jgi:hypothetical protein
MVHGLALAARQLRERRADPLGIFLAFESGGRVDGFLGMAFLGERCMHFAPAMPARPAQAVDCTPLDDDPQPRVERTPRIVGRPRPMDRQQHLLHHVVGAVGWDALAAGEADYERHAIAQQRLVGDAVARTAAINAARRVSETVRVCRMVITASTHRRWVTDGNATGANAIEHGIANGRNALPSNARITFPCVMLRPSERLECISLRGRRRLHPREPEEQAKVIL